MPKNKEVTSTTEETTPEVTENKTVQTPETIQISKSEWEQTQETLKKLLAVADQGRILNYESRGAKKQVMRVKLSVYQGGIVTGWRTVKDELVKHPTTGLTVGEVQEYELLVLGKDNELVKYTVNGYPAFSSARYDERIDAEVVGKEEDFEGKLTFKVRLEDGREIKLGGQFVN